MLGERVVSLIKLLLSVALVLLLLAGFAACESQPASPSPGATAASPSAPVPASEKREETPTSAIPATLPSPATSTPTTADNPREDNGQQRADRNPIPTPAVIPATPGQDPTATAGAPQLPPTIAPVTSAKPTQTPAGKVGSEKPRVTSPDASAEELDALVDGNNTFGLDLYRALSGSEGNLFFSPYSISLGMGMAYAGTSGETDRQMEDTLSFNLDRDRLHPAFNALDLQLASRSGGEEDGVFRLNVANSVWGQEDHPFLQRFLDVLAENYGGEVREVDFRRKPEEARLRINGWVAEETEKRIKDLIPPGAIDRYTRLVLANAVYFNAAWRSAFRKDDTSPGPFFHRDGSNSEVPMMRQKARFGYARGDGFQAVELQYGGGEMAMTILLPDAGRFNEFEGSLDAASMDGILEGMELRLVRLTMPKFEMESTFSLTGTLAEMGMPNAFDEMKAEFAGIDGLSCLAGDDECLLISDVLHKAFVSVDESGTEAAAATAVIIGVTKAVTPPDESITVTVDRPFIFVVRDLETGALLFAGRVLEP